MEKRQINYEAYRAEGVGAQSNYPGRTLSDISMISCRGCIFLGWLRARSDATKDKKDVIYFSPASVPSPPTAAAQKETHFVYLTFTRQEFTLGHTFIFLVCIQRSQSELFLLQCKKFQILNIWRDILGIK
jgi:hypothetical protein